MCGALTPLLIVWSIGTGKLEVLRHDVNEYGSVSKLNHLRESEIFASTLKAMTATRVFY